MKEINENSNIQIIVKNKTDRDILDLFDELISDHKAQSNLKKIENLRLLILKLMDYQCQIQ